MLALRDLASARVSASVLVTTDSGTYIARLHGLVLRIEHRVNVTDSAPTQFRADAASEQRDGEVVLYDIQQQRIATFNSNGQRTKTVALRLAALADAYVAGNGQVAAVVSRVADQPYTSVSGALRIVDDRGATDSVLFTFPTLARRTRADPRSGMYRARPLEHTPIVKWSSRLGWIVASTDTMHLTLRGPIGPVRTIAGSGRRTPVDRALRDSGIALWVAGAGFSADAKTRAREFAEENLFRDRPQLQLIDEVVPTDDGHIALRRMQACAPTQGWNIIDSAGHSAGTLRVPGAYTPIFADTDALLFTRNVGNSVQLVRVTLPSTQIVTTVREGR